MPLNGRDFMDIRVIDGLFRVGVGSTLALGMGASVLGAGGAIAMAAFVDAYALAYFAPKPQMPGDDFEQLDSCNGEVIDAPPSKERIIDENQVELIRMVAAAFIITVAAIVISYVTGVVFLKAFLSLSMSYNVAKISRPLCAMALKSGKAG